MELIRKLQNELIYLERFNVRSIMISTTAKHALDFKVLPRREISNKGLSCFMINDKKRFKETLLFFDGYVDNIYIDIEQKQSINLFKIAKEVVKKSELVTVKPNDTTVESCDLLIRNYLRDDLYNKSITVIGTGNLASKIAIRLAERQANVYMVGREAAKEVNISNALNLFLPKHTTEIQPITKFKSPLKMDIIISFLSGQFTKEETIIPFIGKDTFIIDGGINNFSSTFIQSMLSNNVKIARLDTRIALPYQILSASDYTTAFFNDVFGQSLIQDIPVAAGGYIGDKGTVIVDNIKQPSQVIGIADGRGGVMSDEQLYGADKSRIQRVEKIISNSN